MGEMMRISLCNLTMNCRSTVHAIKEDLGNADFEIAEWIWVDQGSIDGTAEYAKDCQPDILILNRTNLGQPRGTNQGLHAATGDWKQWC